MGRLQNRLDRIKKSFAEQAPAKAQAVMARATEDLRSSGILDGIAAVDSPLPAFSLPDPEGQVVRSADLLAQGPLVLTIYRGGW